ncbi:unnamed protein product, partial [marine sediment metagenome]
RLMNEKISPVILTRRIEKREPKDNSLIHEIPLKLEVYKTRTIEMKKKYSLKTLFFKFTQKFLYIYTYIHWIPYGYLFGRKILEKRKNIKFIFATGPPYYSHMIGYLLKKTFKIPLIVEYRDPWTHNPYGYRKDFNHFINSKIERRILNLADMIIVISKPLKTFLKQFFPVVKKKKISIVENGLNIIDHKILKIKKKEVITFTFIGRLYGRRNIKPLLLMISNLKKNGFFKNIKFLFKIYGQYNHTYLNRLTNQLNISDLVYFGEFLPRARIYEEIINCDL